MRCPAARSQPRTPAALRVCPSNRPCAHACLTPAGNNAISDLASIAYLRQFQRLQIVNLGGNPVARNPNYRRAAAACTTLL